MTSHVHPHRDDESLNGYQRVVVQNVGRHKQLAEFFREKWEEGEWPVIMFCREKAHARAQAHALSVELGIEVPVVTAAMAKSEKDTLAGKMRRRDTRVPVVVATDTWSTGIDIPCLMAAYNIGGGSAPIGLRQRAGRAVRGFEEKVFKLYDVADKTAEGAFEEHNEKRLKHYGRAGFRVSDRALMAQLLDRGVQQPPLQQEGEVQPPPAGERAGGILDLLLDPTSLLIAGGILLLAFTDVCS